MLTQSGHKTSLGFLPKWVMSQTHAHSHSRTRAHTPFQESTSNKREELNRKIASIRSMFPSVPEITPLQVREMSARGELAALVDVRTAEEQAVSRIPASIPWEEFVDRKKEFITESEGSAGPKVCLYCTIGYRSSKAAEKLRKEGIDAMNLSGSILAWTHEGFPLVTRDEDTGSEISTKRLHVYGKQWALQANGYESVYFQWPMLKAAGSLIESWFTSAG
jgi:rhodanese-related sulfurtransferase